MNPACDTETTHLTGHNEKSCTHLPVKLLDPRKYLIVKKMLNSTVADSYLIIYTVHEMNFLIVLLI